VRAGRCWLFDKPIDQFRHAAADWSQGTTKLADEDLRAHLKDGVRLKEAAQREFVRALQTGRMIAFVGSYATEQFGYPDWDKFLKKTSGIICGPPDPGLPLPGWTTAANASFAPAGRDKVQNFELLRIWSKASDGKVAKAAAGQFALTEAKDQAESAVRNLIEALGIKRVITVNYDLEFEYFTMRSPTERDAIGARKNAQESFEKSRRRVDRTPGRFDHRSLYDYRIESVSADGKRVASDVFHRERPDRLFEFAIGSPDHDIHIMHLHGRMTDPETMIVSQSDYDRHYRRSGLSKLPFEHARRTLFAGNPVLFAGVGLSESEFLSSLEQFVSDDNPNHLAPSFAIWSPDACLGGNDKPRTPNEVSISSELWRMRIYRRFGTLVLFDTELPGFSKEVSRTKVKRKTEVAKATALLGQHALSKAKPFGWIPAHFRNMHSYLPSANDPTDPRWAQGSIVWNRDAGSKAMYQPSWQPALQSPVVSPGSLSRTDAAVCDLSDDDYAAYLLRDGSPVKLILDHPGAGHGYLARVLGRLVRERIRVETDTIWFQINAAHAWEIDTTFALVSGLADSKTADSEGMSRAAAIAKFGRDLTTAIIKGEKFARNAVIAINGMDRFFDPGGYPLSHELDTLLRQLCLLSGGASKDDRENYQQWVRETNTAHPVTLLLFGTNRIGRYFDTLGMPRGNIEQKKVGYWDVLGGLRDRYASSEPEGADLRTRIIDDWKRTGSRDICPIAEDKASAYLKSVADAFKPYGLPSAAQALCDRASSKEVGNLRHALFDAYLDPFVLQAALDNDAKKAELCLAVLKTLALIGQPAEAETLFSIMPVKEKATALGFDITGLERFIADKIMPLCLVGEIVPFPTLATRRFGLHRALLHDLRDRYTVPISDARNYASFNLPLLAAQPIDDHESEADVFRSLESLVDDLMEMKVNDTFTPAYFLRLRAATASMRSYYTTSSLLMHEPRDGRFEEVGPRLSNHARRLAEIIRRAEDISSRTPSVGTTPPFFPDDLVWLHDQRGVALLAQGDLYGAREALDQAELINRNCVEFGDHQQNWRRLQLNQLHVDIERGKISHAEGRLHRIEQSVNDQASHDAFDEMLRRYGAGQSRQPRIADQRFPADLILTTGLCAAYRSWCEYFRGRLTTSEHYLGQALNIFLNLGEQRAYAMFMRHRASLRMALGDREGAAEYIRLCTAAADSARQMDISHLAWIAKGEHDMEKAGEKERAAIQQQLNATLRYATLTDMYRVRMEVRRALAKMRLASGDYDGALEQAGDALAVATRFGFALRKISLRILIGQILIRRGDPISGNAMLDQATRTADRIGYQRAVEQAHRIRTEDNQAIAG
jgi:tetratricopeptide (TPR) repeat protein